MIFYMMNLLFNRKLRPTYAENVLDVIDTEPYGYLFIFVWIISNVLRIFGDLKRIHL